MSIIQSKKHLHFYYSAHWIALCILIPFFALVDLRHITYNSSLLFAVALIIYSGTRLVGIASRGENKAVEATFWIFCYVFFGICAFAQIAEQRYPWPGTYSTSELLISQFIILAGMVSFDLSKLNIQKRFIIAKPKNNCKSITITKSKIYQASMLSLPASIYATVKLGGLRFVFMNRTERSAILSTKFDTAHLNILNSLSQTVPFVLFIAALAFKLNSKRANSLAYNILLGVLALWAAITDNPIATPRTWVGTVIIASLFVIPWRRYFSVVLIYGLTLSLVIVLPYADIYRTSNHINIIQKIEIDASKNQLITKPDFDSFQQINNGVIFVKLNGYQMGRQILGSLLFWYPRYYWENKPNSTGVLISETVNYKFTNLSAPLWVEFFIDGGILLVLVGFYLYGRLIRHLDVERAKSTGRTSAIFVFSTIYIGYQLFLLRGALMPAIAYIAPMIIVIFLCSEVKSSKDNH